MSQTTTEEQLASFQFIKTTETSRLGKELVFTVHLNCNCPFTLKYK